jgi:hypothetical protein
VKNTRKVITTMLLGLLLTFVVLPMFLINSVNAANNETLNVSYGLTENGKWWKLQTDLITILFPAAGKKPMFLWWYSNDTSNIYVVKYKGLIEYVMWDYPYHHYYRHDYEAHGLAIQEQLEAKYAMPKPEPHRGLIMNKIRAIMALLDLHRPYLPFSACQWNLTKPVPVIKQDGTFYISFNFTLVEAPPQFDFAENHVIIRCRFYANDTTENVRGLYNYTVHAGELKMDLVVENWKWNIDKINGLLNTLRSEPFNINISQPQSGLALWVDMASINIKNISTAEEDANLTTTQIPESSSEAPLEPIESIPTTSDIIMGGQRVRVKNEMPIEAPMDLGKRLNERFKLRFANVSTTFAGFFDFVNTAFKINSTGHAPINVTAAYRTTGSHMHLFIGYPYFANNTLEHDPSLGVESIVPWLPTGLLMILIGATIAIAVAVAAVKLRKKIVNIVNVQ